MSENPFLDTAFELPWSKLTADLVRPGIVEALIRAQAAVDAIATRDLGTLTFENTFLALERATETLGVAWGKVSHLQSVADSPALREAHNAVLPDISAFYARIPLNTALWGRLRRFSESPEARGLTGVRKRFLDETVADFRQSGADLPSEKRARLEAIQAELSQLTQRYSENVLDATNAWQLIVDDPERLRGLPERAKEAARHAARQKGYGTEDRPVWRFSLQGPSLEPLMSYGEDGELRRLAWQGASRIGALDPYANIPLMRRILALRSEKAEILGYQNFGDMVTERRMAKSAGAALAFIEDIERRARDAFVRECRELEQFKASQTGGEPGSLLAWEVGFWAERLRKASYDFDEEALRPYFPMDRVLSGLYELAARVFGLRILERTPGTVEVWHPEVRFYDVHDRRGRHVGSFYADWHPRESKRGGAWMNYLITGGPTADGGRAPHLGLICGNLTPPVDGKPALLTHREVETVFHEFGHLLHHLLGEVEIHSLNGVNVAWDFVELPSQIMENWCWERESLDLFARHHVTGDPIPEELFSRMRAARRFRAGCSTMRQVQYAKMDLLMHLRAREFVEGDLEAKLRAAVADTMIPTEPPAQTIARRFTHIFADPVGYASGYYSYKWAEVLDADAFTRFLNEGLFSERVGGEFVEHILSKGNSEDPADLFRRFMGRDPNPQALLLRAGLA